MKDNVDNSFKTINNSIATFFDDPSFQKTAISYREDNEEYIEDISDKFNLFLNSNSLFSPGLLFYPCDDTFSSVSIDSSVCIDVDPIIQSSNFDSMVESANNKLSGRSSTIFYNKVVYSEGESTNLFALGKNIISFVSSSETFYKRIGIVFVFFHKSNVVASINPTGKLPGMEACIYKNQEQIFTSNEDFDFSSTYNSNYRHVSKNLSFDNWVIDVCYNNSQILDNISLSVILMTSISLFLLGCYLFVVIYIQRKYQKSLSYLFGSFFRIRKNGQNSLEIEDTGDAEVDNVINSYNSVVRDVILLNKKVDEEKNRALTLEVENTSFSLDSLYTQINKHYIINVLSIIRSLVTLKKYKKASSVIENFSRFLRYSLTIDKYSNFKEEIENAKTYLNIQEIRYPNISFSFDIDESLDQVELPKVILQPVLENCFTHGLKDGVGHIHVSSFKKEDFAVIQVSNDNEETIDLEQIQKVNDILSSCKVLDKKHVNKADGDHNHIALLNIVKRLKIDNPQSKITIEVSKDNKVVVSLYIRIKGGRQ